MLKHVFLSAFIVFGLTACDNDDDSGLDPNIVLPYFTKIVVKENVVVHLSHGSSQALAITGNGDLTQVQQTVSNEVLTLSNNGSAASNVVIAISHPDIDSIAVQNNGQLEFVSDFNTTSSRLFIRGFDAAEIYNSYLLTVPYLDIDLRNAGKMALANINADRMDLQMTNGTRCNIEGSARIQHIDMDSGSRYNIDFPQAAWEVISPAVSDSCWITADNGVRAWVYPMVYLNATVNSGSQVYYKGDSAVIDQDVSNGGELSQKDD